MVNMTNMKKLFWRVYWVKYTPYLAIRLDSQEAADKANIAWYTAIFSFVIGWLVGHFFK